MSCAVAVPINRTPEELVKAHIAAVRGEQPDFLNNLMGAKVQGTPLYQAAATTPYLADASYVAAPRPYIGYTPLVAAAQPYMANSYAVAEAKPYVVADASFVKATPYLADTIEVAAAKPYLADAAYVAAAKPYLADAAYVAAAKPYLADTPAVAAAKPYLADAAYVAAAKPYLADTPAVAAAKPYLADAAYVADAKPYLADTKAVSKAKVEFQKYFDAVEHSEFGAEFPIAKYQTPLVVAPKVFAPINAPLVRYESPKVFTRADSIIPATYYSGYNAYPNTYPVNTYPYSYHNAAYPYYAGFHGMPVVTAPIVSKSAKEAVEAEE